MTKSTDERFWSKVDVQEPDECWNWRGAKLRDGYGSFVLDTQERKMIQAHRYSYITHYKKIILPTEFVCHKCDNSSCVNPYHLFLGTHKENMKDRQDKGRQAKGEKISVLSVSDVLQIKQLIKNKIPRRTIAKQFGVGATSITDIATGRSWSWV